MRACTGRQACAPGTSAAGSRCGSRRSTSCSPASAQSWRRRTRCGSRRRSTGGCSRIRRRSRVSSARGRPHRHPARAGDADGPLTGAVRPRISSAASDGTSSGEWRRPQLDHRGEVRAVARAARPASSCRASPTRTAAGGDGLGVDTQHAPARARPARRRRQPARRGSGARAARRDVLEALGGHQRRAPPASGVATIASAWGGVLEQLAHRREVGERSRRTVPSAQPPAGASATTDRARECATQRDVAAERVAGDVRRLPASLVQRGLDRVANRGLGIVAADAAHRRDGSVASSMRERGSRPTAPRVGEAVQQEQRLARAAAVG